MIGVVAAAAIYMITVLITGAFSESASIRNHVWVRLVPEGHAVRPGTA